MMNIIHDRGDQVEKLWKLNRVINILDVLESKEVDREITIIIQKGTSKLVIPSF